MISMIKVVPEKESPRKKKGICKALSILILMKREQRRKKWMKMIQEPRMEERTLFEGKKMIAIKRKGF